MIASRLESSRMKHILVGFDGSENAHRALEEALEFARADTQITVVGAAQDPAPPGRVSCLGRSGRPRRALVAQRIEHLTTDQEVAGSSPAERASG